MWFYAKSYKKTSEGVSKPGLKLKVATAARRAAYKAEREHFCTELNFIPPIKGTELMASDVPAVLDYIGLTLKLFPDLASAQDFAASIR